MLSKTINKDIFSLDFVKLLNQSLKELKRKTRSNIFWKSFDI